MSLRAAALLFVLAACDGADPPPGYPDETALAVSGVPIPAAEIEAAERRVRFLYPSRSREYTLQAALESFVLPRAAARARFADERERARRDADAAWARIEAGEDVEARMLRGTGQQLTPFLWAKARELDVGAWSGPVEAIGRFALVQLVSRGGYELRESEEELSIRLAEFRYLPATFSPDDMHAALASVRLEIVDPAYESAVPQNLRYLMKGTSTP